MDPHFLDIGSSWKWVISFTPLPLYPREGAPCTHCIGSWADLRVGLDDIENRKFLSLLGLELRPLGRPASRYTDYAIPDPISSRFILILTSSVRLGCQSGVFLQILKS
jgi:hypothetical protein